MSDDRPIESPPEGPSGWRDVWEKGLVYKGPGGIVRRLRRILTRLLTPELDRQRDFNLAMIDLVEGLKTDLSAIRDDLRRHEEKLSVGITRNDALVTVLDQKIEGALTRVRDLSTPLLTATVSPSFRDDYLYRRFEEAARGSKGEVRESMRDLADLFRDHAPVLDVGCGRGELLELCRELGVEARGIDVNERSVAELKENGFDVSVGAIPDALESVEAGSIGTVYASHVVEHLQTSSLIGLMTEGWRILREGGMLVIETPNAQSLMVSGSEFWKDPSHVAPRHPAALIILGRELGFEVSESRTLHPFGDAARLSLSSDQPDELLRLVDRLNEILFGDHDLRLVLRKPG